MRGELRDRPRVHRGALPGQGRLAGGIAHEFNNLMAVVIGNAGLVARRMEGREASRPFLVEIVAAGRRASELTRQLLAFSRSEVLQREALQLTPIVTEVTGMLRRYEVLEARDVPNALRLAKERPRKIDLLLADVVMPQMRGP